MVSARGISLLLLESRSSHTLSSSPQHCGPGGEVTIPPPCPCVAARRTAAPAPVGAEDGAAAAGFHTTSLDLGAHAPIVRTRVRAGFAPFYSVLLLIKKLCIPSRPGPLFSCTLPSAPVPAPRGAGGGVGARAPEPGTSEAPPGPAAPLGPPGPRLLPFAPTQRLLLRASRLKNNSGGAASSAHRHCPGRRAALGPTALGPSRGRGGQHASQGGTARGRPSKHQASSAGCPRAPAPLRPRPPAAAPPSPQTPRRCGGGAGLSAGRVAPAQEPDGPSADFSSEYLGIENELEENRGAALAGLLPRTLPEHRGPARERDLELPQSQPEPEAGVAPAMWGLSAAPRGSWPCPPCPLLCNETCGGSTETHTWNSAPPR
ncbi:PREDICTED: collagen alpha-1(I) chain [Cercocebus atys]|uniref:collagen alpha-1(I) chain n=1 Tax=Cercocebus atys TaxID=9531 RepID=UPI0005F4C6DB|nr:PREDICTED: collagen alpha-1(I) chain [Cercocebus atys]